MLKSQPQSGEIFVAKFGNRLFQGAAHRNITVRCTSKQAILGFYKSCGALHLIFST
ncbi:MAG: hypothetical protein IPM82_29015 [Saprospiraceae bacterium]|nr:hypothetical protein [Saprospiraceae bacterium]